MDQVWGGSPSHLELSGGNSMSLILKAVCWLLKIAEGL